MDETLIRFKDGKLYNELLSNTVRRDIRFLLHAVAMHMETRYLHAITVTSVLGGDVPSRKTNTHEEGRAIDIRVKTWDTQVTDALTEWVNRKFATGAYFKDGKPMLVAVHHDVGHGDHIHLQVAQRPLKIRLGEGKEMLL